MSLKPSANIGYEMPTPIFEVYLSDAAGAFGVAVRAPATTDDRLKLTV